MRRKNLNRFAAISILVLVSSGALWTQASTEASGANEISSQLSATSQGVTKTSALETKGEQGGASTVFIVPSRANLECPVSLHAEHESGGGMRFTRKSRSPGLSAQQPEISQRIHLSVDGGKESSRVIGARVTVYGTGERWRMVPAGQMTEGIAGSKPGESGEMTRSLDIVFHRDGTVEEDSRGGDAADMVLSGFTSVKSITLDSLTYANGAVWNPAAGKSCRVVPNPQMLVSASH